MYKFIKSTIDPIRTPKRLRLILILAGISLLCRFLFTLPAVRDPSKLFLSPDGREYNRLAINVIENHIFSADSIPPYQPEHSRPPLYPLFIAMLYAILGKHPLLVVSAQVMVGALTVILLFLLALRITASEKLSFIASLLFALSPNVSFFSAQLLTETLFSFLLLFAFYFFIAYIQHRKTHHLLISAFALGLSTLTRVVSLYLPIFLVIFLMYLYRKEISKLVIPTLLFLAMYYVTLSPWYARNFVVFKKLVIVEINLLPWHAAMLEANLKKISVQEASDLLKNELRVRAENPPQVDTNNPVEVARLGRKIGLEHIKKAPMIYAKIHFMGMLTNLTIPLGFTPLLLYFTGKSFEQLGFKTAVSHDILILFSRGKISSGLKLLWKNRVKNAPKGILMLFLAGLFYQIIILLFAVIGLFTPYVKKRTIVLFVLVILYFLVVTGPLVESRFRTPIEPFFSMLAAMGFCRVFLRKKTY